jgi:hypothetical protein
VLIAFANTAQLLARQRVRCYEEVPMHALFTTALGAILVAFWMWRALEIFARSYWRSRSPAVAILARIAAWASGLLPRQLSQREFEAWVSAGRPHRRRAPKVGLRFTGRGV